MVIKVIRFRENRDKDRLNKINCRLYIYIQIYSQFKMNFFQENNKMNYVFIIGIFGI